MLKWLEKKGISSAFSFTSLFILRTKQSPDKTVFVFFFLVSFVFLDCHLSEKNLCSWTVNTVNCLKYNAKTIRPIYGWFVAKFWDFPFSYFVYSQ